MTKIIEYRVRPVVRYIVTRYYSVDDADEGLGATGSKVIGEFDSPWNANEVCKAMAGTEEGATATLTDHQSAPNVGL